jgi:hypothetical protein
MTWGHGYRKGDYRRACDICGTEAFFSELRYIGQNRWACRDDAPGLTAEQIARHNNRVPPLLVRQVKHPRPLAQNSTYLDAEARVFKLVRDQWSQRTNVSATGSGAIATNAQRAGAAGMYFAEILSEGTRPTSWITQAATQLQAIADFIVSQQYGTLTGPSPAEPTNSVLYGMVQSVGAATQGDAVTQTYCGLTLIRAYKLLGIQAYLDAANLAATFLRQGLQRRDVAALNPTATYLGGFMDSMPVAKNGNVLYSSSGAGALWFLSELRAVVGGSTVYGFGAAGGDFTGSAAGSLDTAIAEARAFYAGNKIYGFTNPTGTGFAPMSMLSVATPRDGYNSSSTQYAASITNGQYNTSGLNIALGLRGLFAAEGYSATVAAIYEWLLTFTTNPLSVTPAGTSTFTLKNSLTGTYDPNVALAQFLSYADATGAATAYNFAGSPLNAASDYTFVTAGLLAPVRIASGRDCRLTKDTLSPARRLRASNSDNGSIVLYPNMRGLMGLSGQMVGTMNDSGATYAITQFAALLGSVYRYPPLATPNLRTP